MRSLLLILAIAALTSVSTAQRSISDLSRSHAAALETYVAANKNRTFRRESILGPEYLAEMRKAIGAEFKPNYASGDFNGDGLIDFAVLLRRAGKEEWPEGLDMKDRVRSEHAPDFPLTLLIFNGQKGNAFRVAFSQDLAGPNAAFIAVDTKRRKKTLYYGIFETDSDTFLMLPTRSGYKIEYENPEF